MRRSIGLAAALAAGVLAASPGLAYASGTQYQDGFESNPASHWAVSVVGTASAGFDLGAGTARSGANSGWLSAKNGQSAEGIWAPTNSAAVFDSTCVAQIWVEAFTSNSDGIGYVVRDQSGNIVDSGNAGPDTLVPGVWTRIFSNRFPLAGRPRVFVQVILSNATSVNAVVRLDDFALTCTWHG